MKKITFVKQNVVLQYYNVQHAGDSKRTNTWGIFLRFLFQPKKCFILRDLQNNWGMNEGQEFKKIG